MASPLKVGIAGLGTVGGSRRGRTHASRLDGAPLRYNRADTKVPDLVIARPDLAGRILGFCRPQR